MWKKNALPIGHVIRRMRSGCKRILTAGIPVVVAMYCVIDTANYILL